MSGFRISGKYDLDQEMISHHIDELESKLKMLGCKAGDHVAIISENTPEYVILILTLIKMGIVFIPLNIRYSQEEIIDNCKTFNCNKLFHSTKYKHIDIRINKVWMEYVVGVQSKEYRIQSTENSTEYQVPSTENSTEYQVPSTENKTNSLLDNLGITQDLRLNTQYSVLNTQDSLPNTQYSVLNTQDSLLNIILTSGSSGKPKGVMHSLENHLASAEGANEFFEFNSNSSWFLSLPLFHVGGLAIIFRCLLAEAELIIPENELNLDESIVKYPSSHYSFVFTQLKRLVEIYDSDNNNGSIEILKKSSTILLGGSAIPETLIDKCIEVELPIRTSYGCSEMSSTVTATRSLDKDELLTSGYLIPGRELIISNDGEIILSGNTLFKGYYEDLDSKVYDIDEDTHHESRTTNPEPRITSHESRDLAKLDSKGRLIILGRKDRMFISGGENIYPEKIEKAIFDFTGVEACQVVSKEDQEYGKRPIAEVVGKISISELETHLKSKLSKFEIPVHIEIVEKIENSSSKSKF